MAESLGFVGQKARPGWLEPLSTGIWISGWRQQEKHRPVSGQKPTVPLSCRKPRRGRPFPRSETGEIMSFAASQPQEESGRPAPSPGTRLGDLALRLTSRRARDQLTAPAGLPEGWQLRLASPVWHAIWTRGSDRLRRLRVVLLPADIAALGEEERLALLGDQLARMGVAAALPDWLKPALSRAKARLSARLARMD